ncbi:MAG TPA: cytochrome c, partial [Polyangiales bacterium]|nr:cytochrome c [Polyangiales bacterium]
MPPIDRVSPPTVLGPIFALLVVKGDIPVSAEVIDHDAPRAKYPPPVRVSPELGKHLAATCSGCHGPSFAGGPIKGGDPSWPPARNLTPDPTGLAAWSLADFKTALREGKRPDGSKIRAPMPIPYTSKMADAEIESLYAYLKAQPPLPYPAK